VFRFPSPTHLDNGLNNYQNDGGDMRVGAHRVERRERRIKTESDEELAASLSTWN